MAILPWTVDVGRRLALHRRPDQGRGRHDGVPFEGGWKLVLSGFLGGKGAGSGRREEGLGVHERCLPLKSEGAITLGCYGLRTGPVDSAHCPEPAGRR